MQALERVGTPAKGFPALEWLLWTRPVEPGSPACRYAALLAREIDAEAQALSKAFAELAQRAWANDEQAAVAAMGELLNQWVGGLQRLRWDHMEKPLRSAVGGKPAYPRAASGGTRQSWASRWQALRALGVAQGNTVPAPGEGLVPLETYLRGRGLNPMADRLVAASADAARNIQAAASTDPGRTLAAAQALAAGSSN